MSAAPCLSHQDGDCSGARGCCFHFCQSEMILWGNSLRLALLGHRGSPLPIPGGLNNYAIGVCNGKIYLYTHIYIKKERKSSNFLRDLSKRSVRPLRPIAATLRVKSGLFHHIAWTPGCFDCAIPWPILLVESVLRILYSPRPPFFLTWTETTYHTTNVCYFRHFHGVLQFQAAVNYWLFEIYNKCFFHRTEIWWWLQLGAPLKLKNRYVKKRPQVDRYFKI